MTTIDQIKTLMRSGDIAGAEAQCRSQRIGRDVSPKRPRTRHGRVPTRVSKATSRKPQVTSLLVLVFSAILAPLVARADLIGPWTPPNNYKGFLYEHGYFVGGGLSPVWRGILYYGLPVFLGGCLLFWAVSRLRKFPFPKNLWEYVALWAMIVFTVSGGIPYLLEKVRRSMVFMGAAPPEYSLAIFLDTEEHRAEYDHRCIDYFEQWEFSESLARNAPYRVGRSVPEIRPGAPVSVTNAYLKYLEKRDEGFRRIEREKRESKQIPQTEVEPRKQPSQMGGETP